MKIRFLVFVLGFVVCVASFTGASRQAHAIATVNINVAGQSLGQTTLQLTDLGGNVVKEEEESDRAGGIWLWRNLRPGTYRVQTLRNGQPVGSPQTINVQDNAINRFRANSSGGRITTVSSSGAPGNNGVNVTGQTGPGTAGFLNSIAMVSLSIAQGYASIGNDISLNGSNSSGDSIDSHTTSLRGDFRFFPFGFGNLANLALANLSGDDCYVGIQGAVGLSGPNRGGRRNLHTANNDDDTFIDREFLGSVTPYVGCTVAKFANNMGYLNFHAGPRVQFNEWVFRTEESQGGGTDRRVEQNETNVGVAVGAELNLPFGDLSPGGLNGGLQAGAWGTYMPGTDFSAATPVGNYDINTDGFVEVTGRVGVYLKY